MSDYHPAGAPFTGRKLLWIILGFFGVIIAVNSVMLTFALSSFGGLVTPNSYVASQRFNEDVAAQRASKIGNWRIETKAHTQGLELIVRSKSGAPISGAQFKALLGRPTHERENQIIKLHETAPGVYRAQAQISPGAWRLHLENDGAGKELRIFVRAEEG